MKKCGITQSTSFINRDVCKAPSERISRPGTNNQRLFIKKNSFCSCERQREIVELSSDIFKVFLQVLLLLVKKIISKHLATGLLLSLVTPIQSGSQHNIKAVTVTYLSISQKISSITRIFDFCMATVYGEEEKQQIQVH